MKNAKKAAVLSLLAVFILAGVSASFAQGGGPGPMKHGEEGIPRLLEGIDLSQAQKPQIKKISAEIMGNNMEDMRELMESGNEKEIQSHHRKMLRVEFEVWNRVLTDDQKTQVKRNAEQVAGPKAPDGKMEIDNKAMFIMFESGHWNKNLADKIAHNRAEMFLQMGQKGGPGKP